MIQDRIRLPYPWIKIKSELEELLYKLSLAEDEEDGELFLFRLYLQDDQDMSYFSPKEQEEIKGLLSLLIEDTRRHTELIGEMIQEIKNLMAVSHES